MRFASIALLYLFVAQLHARPLSGDAQPIRRAVTASTTTTTTTSALTTATASSDSFCQAFASGCTQVATQGKQAGQVQVVQSCQRTGDATTYIYAFSCQAGGVELAQTVLDATNGQTTQTISAVATATQTKAPIQTTSTVQQVLNQTAVQSSTVTLSQTSTTSTTASTVLQTNVLLGTNILSSAVPTSSLLSRRFCLFNCGSPSSSSTTAKTSSVTPSTARTTTTSSSTKVTSSSSSSTTSASSVPASTASSTAASSPFCLSFASSCTTVCGKVNAKPTTNTCSTKNNGTSATVACYCSSNQSGTSYVLTDVAGKFKLPVQSTQIVSTSTVIQQATTTLTSTLTRTTTVSTSIALATTTVVTTSVVPVVATSATQVSIAPTGRVAVKSVDGTLDAGFLGAGTPEQLFTASLVNPSMEPTDFIAVRDPSSGLYQLQVADGSGDVMAFEYGFGVDQDDFGPGSSSFVVAERVPAGSCSSNVPGGSGSVIGNPCASFVFSPVLNGPSSDNSTKVTLAPTWTDSDGTIQTRSWLFDSMGTALMIVADPDAFESAYGGPTYDAVLTFPA